MIVVLDGADFDVGAATGGLDDLTLISWPERRGFAAAMNAAARTTDTPFFAVLQDDARPHAGWLRPLLETASGDSTVGVVGGLAIAGDGRVARAGAIIGGDGYTANPWIGEPPPRDAIVGVRPFDYLSSSSLLVRRAAWVEVGGFDEEMYPGVYVDADFCTALWNAGWRVLLEPRSVVVHDAGGSISERFRNFLYRRNHERFLAKWGTCFAGRPTFPSGQGDPGSVGEPGGWQRVPGMLAGPTPSVLVEDPASVYVRRERDVLRAYVAELEAQLLSR